MDSSQAALLLSTQGLTNAQVQRTLAAQGLSAANQYQAMVEAGLLKSRQTLTAAEAQNTLQTVLGADADMDAALASLGLSAALEGEGTQRVKLTARKLQEAVQTGKLTQEQAQEIGMRAGVVASLGAQNALLPQLLARLQALGIVLKEQIVLNAKWLVTTPAGWAAIAIGAIAGVTAAIHKHNKAIDEAVDHAKEKYSELAGQLSDVKTQIEENSSQISEFMKLQKTGTLSLTDKEDLKELRAQNRELRIRQEYLERQAENANREIVDASKKKYGKDYGSQKTTRESINWYKEKLSDTSKGAVPASPYLTGNPSVQTSSYAPTQQPELTGTTDSLSRSIAEYEYYTEAKQKIIDANIGKKLNAYSEKDLEKLEEYNTKLSAIEESLINDRIALQEFHDDLSLTGEASSELDSVDSKLKLIDNTILSKGTRLKNYLNEDAFAESKAKLIELASEGELNIDILKTDFQDLNSYMNENRITIEELTSQLHVLKDRFTSGVPKWDYSATIQNLNKAKEKLDILKKFSEKPNSKNASFNLEDYSTIADAFGDVEGLDIGSYIKQLQEAGQNGKQVKTVIGNLSSEYLNLSGILDNVTGENQQLIASFFTEAGVAKANELVTANLAAQELYLKLNLDGSTDSVCAQVSELLKHEAASGAACTALYNLIAEENIFANNGLSVDSKIIQLSKLAQAFGITTDAAHSVNAYLDAARFAGHYGGAEAADSVLDALNTYYRDKIIEYFNSISGNYNDSTDPQTPTASSSKTVENETDLLSELNSELDEYQAKLKAVKDARETYNRYGKISIDQAQEIVNTDFRLLAAYGSEEAALESLGRVKLNEMQIQLARNAIDTINSIRTEADAVQYLAGANVNLANAAGAATEVMMQQAVQAAAARGAMQGAAAETIVQGYQNAMQMLDNVDFSFDGFEIEKTPLDRFRDWFSSLFDWIEVRIERLTDKIERSVTKAKSYLESGKYDTSAYFYKQALSYSYSQIRAQQDAFKKYKQQAEVTLNRAVSEGVVSQEEADSIAKQIKDGTLNISEYSEEMQEVISSCQQWYDKTKNASKALLELHDSIRQYIKDLKDLRDTQRETRLNYLDEKSSIAAGSYTSSSDESYALEYSQLTNKRSLLSYKNRAYDKEVEKVGKDNQKIRSTAKNSVGNELRSGSTKGTSESAKAYKNALKNAKKSIDATRPVKDSDLKVIKAHSLVTYERLYAYNLSLENAEAARWEQALNYSETQNERYQLLKERYDVQKDASDNQISLAKSKASNASSAQEANRYLDEAASGYDTNLSIDKTAVSRLKGAEKRARRNILGLSGKTSVFRKQSSAVREKVNKCIKDAKNAAKAGKAIGAMTLSNLAKYYKEGYVTYGFYKACISYNDQLESRREAEAQLEIDRETVKSEKAAIGAQKFGNVEQEYANQQTAVSDKTSFIKAQQDTKTSRGLSLNESDYQSLMEQSQYEQAIYEKEAIELEKIIQANLASGYWTKTSQEYLDAMSALNSYKVKSQECKTAQEELNHTIAQLPYDTIERALELLDAIANNHKSILDLKSAKGEDLSEADYFRQIQDNNDQIEKLQKERLQAFTDYQKSLADPEGVYGGRTSNEWKEEYLGIDTAINNALTDNETLKASLRDDVYWRDFERAQDALERVQNVIRGISDLISDDMLFDPDGNMTEYGITHAANLVKQYELARKEVQNYTEQIENLNKLQKEGYYEAEKGSEEFQKKLNELQAAMLNSASSMKGFSDSIIGMYKNMAQAELDVLFALIDARNEALQAKKAYYDYDKTIRSKTRDIQSLQAQRAALEGIDTAEAKAQRAALDAQIEEANEDLNDTILEHQLELSQNALESLKETLQDSFDDKWDNIHADLNGISQLMASANELISDSAFTVTSTLNRLLQSYGIDPSAVDTAAVQTSGIRKDSASQDSSQSDFMEKLECAAAESHTLNYEIPKTIQMPSFDADRIPTTVNQTFDNLINIEGSADAATVEDLKNLSKDFLQRSYEYTSQKMYSGYIKSGGKRQI